MKDLFHIETCTDGDSTQPPPADGKWVRFTGNALVGAKAAEDHIMKAMRPQFPHVDPRRMRIAEWPESEQLRETLTDEERAHLADEHINHFGVVTVLRHLEIRRGVATSQEQHTPYR
jgi:hypothetical protein